MSSNRDDRESVAGRCLFISGIVTVIMLVVMRRFLFRLPPLGMLALAGLLWVCFFVFMMRRGATRPPQ